MKKNLNSSLNSSRLMNSKEAMGYFDGQSQLHAEILKMTGSRDLLFECQEVLYRVAKSPDTPERKTMLDFFYENKDFIRRLKGNLIPEKKVLPKKIKIRRINVKKIASSSKSVGLWWLRESSQLVIQSYFSTFKGLKPIGLFRSKFSFVI